MKTKRSLCMLLLTIFVLPLLVMSAFATNRDVVANGLRFADSQNKSSWSDGVYTATGAGGRLSAKENTITITNIGANKANITFDYTATGYGSFNIDGSSTASGSIDWTLNAGDIKTIKIKGTSSLLSGGTDGVLTIRNITYTELIEGTATITYNDLGSVTVNDAAFASGSTTATLTETGAKLVATPNSGASFVAWVKADTNEVISQSATYTLKPYAASMKVQAVFTTATSPAYFMTGSTLYNELNAAMTAASNGDKKVVVISSGTLASGTTYSINSGISVLVPYSNSDFAIDSSTVIDDSGGQGGTLLNANMELITLDSEGTSNSKVTAVMEPNTSVLYTLTIPSGTTVNVSGKLVVGGALVAGTNSTTGVCGATGGAHSNIQLDGTINVKSGGVLSTCGYILGSGTITAESNGTVYQPFVLMDHKDGHYLYAAKENNRWPVYRYSIQNIRCSLVLNSGSDMYGYSAVFTRKNTFAAARFNPSVVQMVGSGSDKALFLVNSASMTMTYQAEKTVSVTSSANNNSKGYYNKVGTITMTFNGDAALGSIELSVVVMGSNYNMTSANSEVPIPYNFNLVQNSGTFNVANNMALLPGSTFTVNSGAFMTVASGKSLVIYDGLRDYATRAESVTPDGDDQTGGTWPMYHYPSSDNLQSGGFSRTAELIMNGTLTVNGNLGGTVQTNGTTGKIVMGTSAGTTATGTFGMQNKTSSILSMTIAGSCGKTVRTLDAQVFIAGSAMPIKLQAGKTFVATGAATNTLTGYTYSVYATHDGSATTESKTNLNAVVVGTWMCETHSFEKVATTATCTEAGTATYTCSTCGHTKTESEVALGHVDIKNATGEETPDHRCDHCNLIMYYATNVRLGNSLDMMFAFPNVFTDHPDSYYIKIVRHYADGTTKEETYSYANEQWTVTTGYIYFTYAGLSAKEMCDKIEVTLCTANGDAISVTWVDSIRDYAMRLLDKHKDNEPLRTLLVDMLNYGAACQNYFGYGKDDLANALLNKTQNDYASAKKEYSASNVDRPGWKASQLVVESNIRYNIVFAETLTYNGEALNTEDLFVRYTYTGHKGNTVIGNLEDIGTLGTVEIDGTKYRCLTIAKMVVADAAETDFAITVTITNLQETIQYAQWTDSIKDYTARQTDTDPVYGLFMQFAESAYTYLHSEERIE